MSRQPLSILQQAQFVDEIARRCVMSNGSVAGETFVLLTAEDARHMADLARRLFLIAPYEQEIRDMVKRRG